MVRPSTERIVACAPYWRRMFLGITLIQAIELCGGNARLRRLKAPVDGYFGDLDNYHLHDCRMCPKHADKWKRFACLRPPQGCRRLMCDLHQAHGR